MDKTFTVPRFALPRLVARVGKRLPQWPHSLALATALDVARRAGMLPADRVSELEGRTFRVSVLDAGGVADFTVVRGRFRPVLAPAAKPDLHFLANLSAFLQLLARQEDPDTLFFNRQLAIEGDTELGLMAKNMLDAVEWSALDRAPLPAWFKGRLGLRV